MSFPRRTLLMIPAALIPAAALAQGAGQGTGSDPRLAERAAGKADAPVTVVEYFSLTCSHCATFHRDVWPRVKRELVDTGKVRMVWRDFPLDEVALAAAQVARALPPERYEGFISALLATQDRWAFARGADHIAEIAKVAALAGMSREQVDAAISDQALRRAVLEGRLRGEQEHRISSTPSFVFGNRTVPGAIPYERFAELAGA